MGLFNLLKNGLTIEKKKKDPAPTAMDDESAIDETEVTNEPVTEQSTPVTDNTPTDKRLAAEYILYGDTNVGHTAEPAPKPTTTVTEPAPSAPTQQTFNAYSSNVTSTFNNALLGQATANQNLLVISPKSPAEISAILSNLASGNACIVSLANIADAQRHLDYICGFMNAIGGTIMQRTQTEYILTPKGVGIKS